MKPDVKKIIITNLPYLLFVWLFGKVGEAWRLAVGVDASQKMLHFMDSLAAAFANDLPSFHPFDLCIMCYELIQLIAERNSMHDMDSWMLFRWVFKSAAAIILVSNTWNIVMGVFDITQSVVNQSAGVIIGNTSIDITSVVTDLDTRLSAMDIGGLLGLWFQSLFVGLTMNILSICIMLVVYGRMIEIYLVTSLGPIPLATIGNSEWRGMGQGYLKSLFALGFQAFLIMVVTGIYAVLVQSIALSDDVSGAIWGCMGYTVLLCFCLFKTGSIAKAVFAAH